MSERQSCNWCGFGVLATIVIICVVLGVMTKGSDGNNSYEKTTVLTEIYLMTTRYRTEQMHTFTSNTNDVTEPSHHAINTYPTIKTTTHTLTTSTIPVF